MKGHLCSWGEQCPAFTAWHQFMSRRVRVFDNGGTTADRYTVSISRTKKGVRVWDVYNMSEEPNSPQGVNQFSHTQKYLACIPFTPSKRVTVQNLPAEVIRAIEHRT